MDLAPWQGLGGSPVAVAVPHAVPLGGRRAHTRAQCQSRAQSPEREPGARRRENAAHTSHRLGGLGLPLTPCFFLWGRFRLRQHFAFGPAFFLLAALCGVAQGLHSARAPERSLLQLARTAQAKDVKAARQLGAPNSPPSLVRCCGASRSPRPAHHPAALSAATRACLSHTRSSCTQYRPA